MDQLLSLTNVFGAVGALGIISTITLWRAWAKERHAREHDWHRFDKEIKEAHDQVVEQMELRLQSKIAILENYSKTQAVIGNLNDAIIRVETVLGTVPRN